MKKFIIVILDLILARGLTNKNLERSLVRLRALVSGTLIALSLMLILYLGEKTRTETLEFNAELFVGIFFGSAGVIWALHTAFDSEFVSKFQRLATLHDALVSYDENEKPHYISRKYICFADDCFHYKLHENPAFSWTFKTVVMTIVHHSQNEGRKSSVELRTALINFHIRS